MATKLDTKISVKLSTDDYNRLYTHSQAVNVPMTRLIRTAALERIEVDEFVASYRKRAGG